MTPEVRPPDAGPDWTELASLDRCAAVLDPTDTAGLKNELIDRVHKRGLGRALSPLAGRDVLDFGCGTGRLSEWLLDQGARVTGVDATSAMVARARELVPGGTFIEIDGFRLPLEPASVDLVVTAYVMQYYVVEPETMRALLGEFKRVLRPGGRVAIIEQVADQTSGRSAADYSRAFQSAGYELVAQEPLRFSDSRLGYVAERWGWFSRLAMLPALLEREARRRARGGLRVRQYNDVLFSARA